MVLQKKKQIHLKIFYLYLKKEIKIGQQKKLMQMRQAHDLMLFYKY